MVLGQSSIMNFTHVYEAYGFMQGDAFTWVDCTQIEGTDCYCDVEAERQLKKLMESLPLQAVHWIDSGDYHYVSKLWTDRIDEPFTLVVLDQDGGFTKYKGVSEIKGMLTARQAV